MTTVRHVSQCCSLCYSFSFSHKYLAMPSWFQFTTAILRVVLIFAFTSSCAVCTFALVLTP